MGAALTELIRLVKNGPGPQLRDPGATANRRRERVVTKKHEEAKGTHGGRQRRPGKGTREGSISRDSAKRQERTSKASAFARQVPYGWSKGCASHLASIRPCPRRFAIDRTQPFCARKPETSLPLRSLPPQNLQRMKKHSQGWSMTPLKSTELSRGWTYSRDPAQISTPPVVSTCQPRPKTRDVITAPGPSGSPESQRELHRLSGDIPRARPMDPTMQALAQHRQRLVWEERDKFCPPEQGSAHWTLKYLLCTLKNTLVSLTWEHPHSLPL